MNHSGEQIKIPFWFRMQTKFALSYAALIIAVLVLLNTYPILAAQDMVFKAKQTSIENQASVISSALSPLGELTSEGISQVMEMLDDIQMSRVIVTNQSGRILFDTESNGNHAGYALIQEINLALGGKDVVVLGYKSGAFRTSAAQPIMYRNATIGSVYLYEYDSEQGTIITGLQQTLLRISAIILACAVLVSFLLSRTLTRRISRLTSGIANLREGTYSTRVKVSGRDELATLAIAFNDMTERLEATDEMRKRFVSDASHELKTPLAAIKLLTDSITQADGMDIETMREFMEDIGSEADRLTRITERLLALTRMDNSGFIQRTAVDMTDVISDALHMLNPLAYKRSITIHLTLEEGCIVYSSSDEMYQVLFNLVENAIKYNVSMGKIWLRTRKTKDQVIISVEDTGIGIPKSDRDRIFERFYRVDKARSREAGGTGLGLSIVKDTVVLNGGTIVVDGRPGGGTMFIVTLPLYKPEQEKEAKT